METSDIPVTTKIISLWIKKGLLPAGRLPACSDLRILRQDWESFVTTMFVPANDDLPEEVNAAAVMSNSSRYASRREEKPTPRAVRDFFDLGKASAARSESFASL